MIKSDENRKCLVVTQPMYFPWSGFFELLKQSDEFVYYNDVQYTKGFFNRVQIKTENGIKWLSVPLNKWHRGQDINQIEINYEQNWKERQINQLIDAYKEAPFRDEMLDMVHHVFSVDHVTLDQLSIASTEAIMDYFPSLFNKKGKHISSRMDVGGESSHRLLNLCQSLNATEYLTGHGAKNYLNYEIFEKAGIDVSFIEYSCTNYKQIHEEFTPYVSMLDLIANCGKEGVEILNGKKTNWRQFVERNS